MNHRSLTLVVVASLAPFASAAEVRTAEPFVGVVHRRIVQTANDTKPPVLPRPVVVNLFEIDTAAPGVRFLMSPGNGDAPGEVTREPTRKFMDRVGAQIGINVGFYDTSAKYGGLDTDLIHLSASEGRVFSAAKGGEWVFDVSREGRPRIAKADGPDATTIGNGTPVYNAGGGNQPMLRGGEVVTPNDNYTKALNPHTAVGVSKDGKTVYLCVVDGRQNGYSEGLRTDEMAKLMASYGAWDAINWDGGGSTTLAIDDTDDGKGNSRLVNSPSDNSSPAKPGSDRVVANSLAVFATPKPGYAPLPPVPRPALSKGLDLLATRTIIEDFEGGVGRFDAESLTSGSNRGIAPTSTAVLDATVAKEGKSSLKVTIVSAEPKPEDAQLRFLSAGARPKGNVVAGKAMGNDGFVGVWLRRDAGSSPLYVALVVDEGVLEAVGTERSPFFEVKADGQWHLYEWGLNEDAKWFNYNAGNGKIDGPNVFVDSLLFRGAKADEKGGAISGTVWIDSLTYQPDGHVK